MRHTKDNCLAHHQIIADDCGLACANCGECKCGECNQPKTPWNSLPHEKKYAALNNALGIKVSSGFMGRTTQEWKALIEKDEHLNNVPISEWDKKALQFVGRKNPLWKGWTLSLADMVCAFKRAVKTMVSGTN